MHYKLVDEKPKTFILVFETNDELAQACNGLLQQNLAKADICSAANEYPFPALF